MSEKSEHDFMFYENLKQEFLKETKYSDIFVLRIFLYRLITAIITSSLIGVLLIFLLKVPFAFSNCLHCFIIILIVSSITHILIDSITLGFIIINNDDYYKNFWFLIKCLFKNKKNEGEV